MPLLALCAVLIGTGILAFFLTGLVRRYALSRLVDIPNLRSSHCEPTPRGGGLALVTAFFAGCLVTVTQGWVPANLSVPLLSGLLIAAVGFWDDHGHVPAHFRMAAHIAAASWALLALGGFSELPLGPTSLPLGWVGAAFALLWLVWLLNLFNFMDGIDAIAGSEVIFVAVAAAILMFWNAGSLAGVGVCSVLLAAATLGFLIWNWPPAKIFMGDVGSGFVGYSLGLLALVDMKTNGGGLGLPVWLILNGVFLVDATYTLLWRMVTGQKWYEAHRSHAYQKAAVILGGHGVVVKYVIVINLLWLFPLAVAAKIWPSFALAATLIALAPPLALAIGLKAGQR